MNSTGLGQGPVTGSLKPPASLEAVEFVF